MKRMILLFMVFLSVLMAMADGIYIVNTDLKAYPYKSFVSGLGKPAGVLVESDEGSVLAALAYDRDCTFKFAADRVAKWNGTKIHLPSQDEMNILAGSYTQFNVALYSAMSAAEMFTALKSKGPLDDDPSDDAGVWLSDGSFLMCTGQVGSSDADTKSNAIYLFPEEFIKKIVKPYESKPAGPLKATLTVTPTDRSGANYRNRPGHIYMVEDVKVTIQNMNGNMPTDPAVVGYGEVMGVSLEMILPNGNSVEVGDWQRLELIPHYPNDQAPYYDDSKTFNCRFLNMWRKLHTGYGSKVFKYRYSVKYRGKIIGKTPVRQITIINEPKPVMNVRIVK